MRRFAFCKSDDEREGSQRYSLEAHIISIIVCNMTTISMIYRKRVAWLGIAIIISLWAADRRRHWNETEAVIESKLMVPESPRQLVQSWDDLPPVAQRYLTRVFSSVDTLALAADEDAFKLRAHALQVSPPVQLRSVQIEQSGQFSFSEGQTWVSFIAKQLLTQSGFIWNAKIQLVAGAIAWTSYLPIAPIIRMLQQVASVHVCDAVILDEDGMLQVSWLRGLVMLAKTKDLPQDELWLGEALRWLAETALLPTALLPEAGLVIWKDIDDNGRKDQAILELILPLSHAKRDPVQVVATFDSIEGWLMRVDAMRPKITADGVEMGAWMGVFSRFEWVDEALAWIPSRMEAGWKGSDRADSRETFSMYFRGNNQQFKYSSQ
jgi:hypothetical protein